MKRTLVPAALFIATATATAAPPQIAAILNAASYIKPGLPNYGIAPGSMFVVFGTELGPAVLQQPAGYPYPTSLGATSMRVTVGATSVDAIMVYTSATQVAAILPSNTPVGIGLLSVTYQGRTSEPGAFRVSRSAPGLLTLTETGTGPALAQNVNSAADQPRNGVTHAARPGQTVTLWATGLGPITGSDSNIPTAQDLNVALQVFVGGVPATVTYKGRSGCCAGVDQIVIQIPRGVEGCYVPVYVRMGDVLSNFASLSIASSGEVCTDLNGLSGTDLEKLQTGGTIATGMVSLATTRDCDDYYFCYGPVNTYSERGSAYFSRVNLQAASGQTRPGLPPTGSCTVMPPPAFTPGGPISQPIPLDAGPVLNIGGPKGVKQISLLSPGNYAQTFSTGAKQVEFLQPGDYVIDNGAGGADIGPFRATLSVPKPFTPTIQRSASGVKVSWTGGSPTGLVTIEGSASTLTGVGARFTCTERIAAGQFTIPAEVFLSIPPDGVDHAGLNIAASSSTVVNFKARGLDYGQFSFSSVVQ